MERTIKIASKELRELLTERNKIVTEGREQDAERQRLEGELNKKGLSLQKIDGKAAKIIEKKNIELKRDLDNKVWEEITSVGLEGEKIAIKVSDKFAEYANAIKKAQEEQEQAKVEEEKKED